MEVTFVVSEYLVDNHLHARLEHASVDIGKLAEVYALREKFCENRPKNSDKFQQKMLLYMFTIVHAFPYLARQLIRSGRL
jgi:hypothetical protein